MPAPFPFGGIQMGKWVSYTFLNSVTVDELWGPVKGTGSVGGGREREGAVPGLVCYLRSRDFGLWIKLRRHLNMIMRALALCGERHVALLPMPAQGWVKYFSYIGPYPLQLLFHILKSYRIFVGSTNLIRGLCYLSNYAHEILIAIWCIVI